MTCLSLVEPDHEGNLAPAKTDFQTAAISTRYIAPAPAQSIEPRGPFLCLSRPLFLNPISHPLHYSVSGASFRPHSCRLRSACAEGIASSDPHVRIRCGRDIARANHPSLAKCVDRCFSPRSCSIWKSVALVQIAEIDQWDAKNDQVPGESPALFPWPPLIVGGRRQRKTHACLRRLQIRSAPNVSTARSYETVLSPRYSPHLTALPPTSA